MLPPGGLSFVDARDAADAFVAAMDRGRPAATYLLGAANWTFERYFQRLEEITGAPAPWLRAPGPLAVGLAAVAHGALGLVGRPDPSLDPVLVEMAQVGGAADFSAGDERP